MNLFVIVFKNMRQRALATLLTIISVALGITLTIAILLIREGIQDRFEKSSLGYDLVVGAKGSPLQLVLNTVFNLDISPGNIPWARFKQLQKDPRVKLAIPFSVGDNYKGFRIIGTTDRYFNDFEFGHGTKFSLQSGRIFKFTEGSLKSAFIKAEKRALEPTHRKAIETHQEPLHEDSIFEAVIGDTVARETGLKVGDTFIASHGVQINSGGHTHDDHPWVITGILNPTQTSCDRSIYINLDSFYHIEGHEIRPSRERGSKTITSQASSDPDNEFDHGMISSIVIKVGSPIFSFALYRQINDSQDAMAAFPEAEIRKLFKIIGNINSILFIQALLIVVVAGIGIAVSIYNTMSDRRRELAIMRTLGARRRVIFSLIILESVSICFIGSCIGFIGGHSLVACINPILLKASGFTVNILQVQWVEALVLLACVGLGTICGLIPAILAYKTDIAKNLAPTN